MKKPTILLFGDSITRGAFDTKCGGWADRLKAFANKKTVENGFKPVINVMNLGIGGQTTDDLLRRFLQEAKERQIPGETFIAFAFGTNDAAKMATGTYGVAKEKFESNIRQALNEARTLSDNVLFLTNPPVVESITKNPSVVGKTRVNADIESYNESIRRLCKEKSADCADIYRVFEAQGDYAHLFVGDGIHPNSQGHELIFGAVKDYFAQKGILK